jgi:hypothetical protein
MALQRSDAEAREAAGTSHVLPGRAYPMYAEDHRGETAGDVLEVE